MDAASPLLNHVFEGWEGFNTSLLHTIELTPAEALTYRAAPEMRSVGEIMRHISLGRINWFHRMDAPGSEELVEQMQQRNAWKTDATGHHSVVESDFPITTAELTHWLQATWGMVEQTLNQWTVADLFQTYRHTYWGQTYAVSRQWTLWRIMCHDIYHGGQLTILLGSQGIDLPELASLGGHLTEPPLADAHTSTG
ncbi:MAG: DinB family protein [Abitibacteriaceae bacterium]|nr:DinB family protein [Abditibacteriaceae bacterium]